MEENVEDRAAWPIILKEAPFDLKGTYANEEEHVLSSRVVVVNNIQSTTCVSTHSN